MNKVILASFDVLSLILRGDEVGNGRGRLLRHLSEGDDGKVTLRAPLGHGAFLVYRELTQQDTDSREKRTAKRLCVTNGTGLLLACFVVSLASQSCFLVFDKRIWKVKLGRKLCQTKSQPRAQGKARKKRPGDEVDKIIVTLVVVTRGLTYSFICRPVAL